MTQNPTPEEIAALAEEKLSKDLGVDVAFLELNLRLRIDIEHLRRGEPVALAYVLIDREHHPDVAIVYPDAATADAALEDSLLIEDLCQEDCLDARRPDVITLADLTTREIILP